MPKEQAPAPLAGESEELVEELSVLGDLNTHTHTRRGSMKPYNVLHCAASLETFKGRGGQRPASRSRTEMLGEVRPLDRWACAELSNKIHQAGPGQCCLLEPRLTALLAVDLAGIQV